MVFIQRLLRSIQLNTNNMKYQVINKITNQVEDEFNTEIEAIECVDFEHSFFTHSLLVKH